MKIEYLDENPVAILRNSSAHAIAASGVLDEEASGQVGGVRLQQPAELPADPNQMRLLSDSFVLLPSDEGSTDIAGIVEVLLHFRRQCEPSDIPLEFFFPLHRAVCPLYCVLRGYTVGLGVRVSHTFIEMHHCT